MGYEILRDKGKPSLLHKGNLRLKLNMRFCARRACVETEEGFAIVKSYEDISYEAKGIL